MSNVTNTDAVVTEQKLTEFYEDIKPFLGCPAYVTQEGDEMYFSTDEKVVGRWIDGKPIYQKTWNGSFALNTNAVVINSIQVPNAGTMVGAELVSDDGIVGDRYVFAFKECGWNSERKLRVSISSGSYTMTSITLRYTKDSD